MTTERPTPPNHKEEPMYRQGDVLIRRVDTIPSKTTKIARDAGRIVLAYGEVTGHAHAIRSKAAVLVEADNQRFLRIMERAFVEHEEHATVTLEPGIYEVIRQREWTDADEPRRVAD